MYLGKVGKINNRNEVEVINFRTDEEYGCRPYFGTFKTFKKNYPEPERKGEDSVTFSVNESYYYENGQLRQRTTKYTLNDDGSRTILSNE